MSGTSSKSITASWERPPPYVLHKFIRSLVCSCGLSVFVFGYILLCSFPCEFSLCNPSEPLSSLSDASTFASAHALIYSSNSASNVWLVGNTTNETFDAEFTTYETFDTKDKK